MFNKNAKLILIIALVVSGYWLVAFDIFAVHVTANISTSSSERYAWNDVIGWIDFGNGEVEVTSSNLKGYANSQVGFIAFDCATSLNPPIDCDVNFPNWKVTNDDTGNLSGWAWNDAIGWISFNCANILNGCFDTNYKVTISAGEFSGWAWNDVIGWISFNCGNDYDPVTPGIQSYCGNIDYKVKTTWGPPTPADASLTSSIFDTQVMFGAAINTIMWQGVLYGGEVKFKIASSNDSGGPWSFIGYDGSETTFYQPAGPDVPIKINLAHHNNKRYVRYKIFLTTNLSATQSPRVDDVIINWSR